MTWTKEQWKLYKRKWRKENIEKSRAIGRKNMMDYYWRNQEMIAAKKCARKYGISWEEVVNIWHSPCGICGRTPKETGKRSQVDHNHKTNVVRGPLCGVHNRIVGYIEKAQERNLVEKIFEWVKR